MVQSLRWTPWIALCHLWPHWWSPDDYFGLCDFFWIQNDLCHLGPTWFGVPFYRNPLYIFFFKIDFLISSLVKPLRLLLIHTLVLTLSSFCATTSQKLHFFTGFICSHSSMLTYTFRMSSSIRHSFHMVSPSSTFFWGCQTCTPTGQVMQVRCNRLLWSRLAARPFRGEPYRWRIRIQRIIVILEKGRIWILQKFITKIDYVVNSLLDLLQADCKSQFWNFNFEICLICWLVSINMDTWICQKMW